MAHDDKRAWILLVVTVVAYGAYAFVVPRRADGVALMDVPYAAPLLWSIGLAIGASIVLDVVTSVGSPRNENRKDLRDKEISRVGDYTGQSLLVIGALAALGLNLAEVDYFWIANTIYLGFLLSAMLGSITRIAGYRVGFQQW
jgi:hypothetical protein